MGQCVFHRRRSEVQAVRPVTAKVAPSEVKGDESMAKSSSHHSVPLALSHGTTPYSHGGSSLLQSFQPASSQSGVKVAPLEVEGGESMSSYCCDMALAFEPPLRGQPELPSSAASCVATEFSDQQTVAGARQDLALQNCSDDMKLAVYACSPDVVCPLLRRARCASAHMKRYLPNLSDLKDEAQQEAVRQVLGQMNAYETFVVDFMSESSEFIELFKMLMLEQSQLRTKTNEELQRPSGWDRSKISTDVAAMRKEVDEVMTHVRTKSNELQERLRGIRGDKITDLVDMINGSEYADPVALERFRQTRVSLQLAKGKLNLTEVELALLQHKKEVKEREIAATEQKLGRFAQKGDHLQKNLENLASQSFEKFGLYLQALQQQQDLLAEPEEEDSHLAYLRDEIRKKEQELAARSNDFDHGDADAFNHFIVEIESTNSMTQEIHDEILQAVRSFAKRRLDAGFGGRDRVSVISFHFDARVMLFNRTWEEFIRFQFFFQRGDYCRYTQAFSCVHEHLVNKVQAPNPGQKINTYFMLFTSANSANDKSLEDICASVRRCTSQACSGINEGSGFALSVGDRDVSGLREVVKAMNDNRDTMTDETGHTRSLLQQARCVAEIMPSFDEMAQWLFGKQPNWKKEFGQLEYLKQLHAKQENKGQERLSCAVKRTAEALRVCEQLGQDERKTMQEEKDTLRSHLQNSLQANQKALSDFQKAVDTEHIQLGKLEGDIRQKADDLEEVRLELKFLQDTGDAQAQTLTALTKADAEKRAERFAHFSPELQPQGEIVKDHLSMAQLEFRGYIIGFSTAIKGLSNSVKQLEQAVDGRTTSETVETATIKVSHYFFQHGVCSGVAPQEVGKGKGLVVSTANFKRILKSICPEASDEVIDLFADIMEMEDFITETCLQKTERSEMQENTDDKLRDKLAERPEVSSEQDDVSDATLALQQAKAELKDAADNVKASVDAGADKVDIKAAKDDEKIKKTNVRNAEKGLAAANKALNKAIVSKFGGVLNMLNRVSKDLRNVYQRVVLNDGADRCESALQSMNDLCANYMMNFCASHSQVKNAYIEDKKSPLFQLCDESDSTADHDHELRPHSRSGGSDTSE